eukprot:jgi/Picsp_1/2739/NSC_00967-R1_protein
MEGIVQDVLSGKSKVRCSLFVGNATGHVTSSSFLEEYDSNWSKHLDLQHARDIEVNSVSEACTFTKLEDILDDNEEGKGYGQWNQIEPSKFENFLLEFVRLQAEGLFEAVRERNTQTQHTSSGGESHQSQKNKGPVARREKSSASYHYKEDDFPRLGGSNKNERKTAVEPERSPRKSPVPSGLEARISLSNSGQKPPGPKRKHSGRRIVPTAVATVEVDEKFVGSFEDAGDLKDDVSFARSSFEKVAIETRATSSKAQTRMEKVLPTATESHAQEYVCKPSSRLEQRVLDSSFIERKLENAAKDESYLQIDLSADLVANCDVPEREEIRNLGLLHAAILRISPRISISREINFLISLLAVEPSLANDKCSIDNPVFVNGADAVNYSCIVLLNAGNVICSLGKKLIGELTTYCTSLSFQIKCRPLAELTIVLKTLNGRGVSQGILQLRSLDSQNQGTGSLSGHFGLNAFINDKISGRSSEERMKLSNRENFRDSWFSLMKEAVSCSSSLQSDVNSTSKTTKPSSKHEDSGDSITLQVLQKQAGNLLRYLRRDNFDSFAELFTAAVLQAAATGETLMDEELTGLAKRNLSKFHFLNRRLQGRTTQPGNKHNISDQQQAGNNLTRKQGRPNFLPNKRNQDYSSDYALDISTEFSKAVRPFVLFLEAADSHRLDVSLMHVMKAKLISLVTSAEENQDLGESKLGVDEFSVATSTLAAFLGYLSFSKGEERSKSPSESPLGSLRLDGIFDGSHPLDVLKALEESLDLSCNGKRASGNIFRCLPWICRYIKFLVWDNETAELAYFQKVFSILRFLRFHPSLLPVSGLFMEMGVLCLRSMLDDVAWIFPEYMDQCTAPLSNNEIEKYQQVVDILYDDVQWANSSIGDRYVEMTCPLLIHSGILLGSNNKMTRPFERINPKTIKKIRPTIPKKQPQKMPVVEQNGKLASVTFSSAVSTEKSTLLQRLERVFLDQYSSSDSITNVKLREIVAFASDAIARQGVAAGLEVVQQDLQICDVPKEVDSLVNELFQYLTTLNRGQGPKIDRKKLMEDCMDHVTDISSRLVKSMENRPLERFQSRVNYCAKNAAEIFLPNEWGSSVKQTAASIISRKATSLGIKQLEDRVEYITASRVKDFIEEATKRIVKE